MSFIKWVFIGMLILPAAEIAAFLLVVHLTGWFWAIAMSFATSVMGVVLLRSTGRGGLERLRHGDGAVHLRTPAAVSMLAGILLILPGFITDLLGAALLIPPLRRSAAMVLARLVRQRRRPPDRRMVDLEPGEWHQIPDHKAGRRRKT
jgi:UPF0716 protein FxsA